MKQAAVALIVRDGLILGIARKNDPGKFGLIGGKSDGSEHPVQTVQRECLEEVGIEIVAGREVFVREEPGELICSRCGKRNPHPDEDCMLGKEIEETGTESHDLIKGEDFHTHCFYASVWSGEPKNLEGTEVRWLTAAELISPEVGAFPDYNTKTLEAFRKMFPDVKLEGEK
jgi:8-oxo-dGTP pyrophosphatase MutT (NUDIX family)